MPVKKSFNFALNQQVIIIQSGEAGVVIARSHSIDSNPQYQIRYATAQGVAVESWWGESALQLR